MIIIYKNLILKYISFLTPTHVWDYAESQNIPITKEEANTLYQFVKEYYQELLENDTAILKLKPLIREDLYNQVYALYQENKTKYLS